MSLNPCAIRRNYALIITCTVAAPTFCRGKLGYVLQRTPHLKPH